MINRRFGSLIDQAVGRIERRRSALCHIGNARSPKLAFFFATGGYQINAIKHDRAAGNATAWSRKPHCSQSKCGFTRTGFTDQPQHFTTL